HPAVASENSDAASKPIAELVDSLACFRRTAHDGYLITRHSRSICGEVEFVNTKNGLNPSTRRGDQVAINQTRAQWRAGYCGDNHHAINVRHDHPLTPFIGGIGSGKHSPPWRDSGNAVVQYGDFIARHDRDIAADVANAPFDVDAAEPWTDADDKGVYFARFRRSWLCLRRQKFLAAPHLSGPYHLHALMERSERAIRLVNIIRLSKTL